MLHIQTPGVGQPRGKKGRMEGEEKKPCDGGSNNNVEALTQFSGAGYARNFLPGRSFLLIMSLMPSIV